MIRSIQCCSDCHYQNSKQIRFSADSQDSSAEDGNITSCTYTTCMQNSWFTLKMSLIKLISLIFCKQMVVKATRKHSFLMPSVI